MTVGLGRPFQVERPADPAGRPARRSPSGSQNQAFDCDTGVNFQNEISSGCQTTYRENYGDWDGTGSRSGATSCAPAIRTAPAYRRRRSLRVRCRTASGWSRVTRSASSGRASTPRLKNPSCAPNNWPEDLADFPRLLHDVRLRERSALRHAHRDGLRRVHGPGEQPGGAREVLRRLLHHRLGQDREQPPSAPTTSRTPGTRRDTARASTTATSGATSSTSSSSRRPGPGRQPLQLRRGRHLHRRPRRVASLSREDDQLGGDATAEEATAAREPQLVARGRSTVTSTSPSARQPRERVTVERVRRRRRARPARRAEARAAGARERAVSASIGSTSRGGALARARARRRSGTGSAGSAAARRPPSRPRRFRARGSRDRASSRGCAGAQVAAAARSRSRQKFAVSYQR